MACKTSLLSGLFNCPANSLGCRSLQLTILWVGSALSCAGSNRSGAKRPKGCLGAGAKHRAPLVRIERSDDLQRHAGGVPL